MLDREVDLSKITAITDIIIRQTDDPDVRRLLVKLNSEIKNINERQLSFFNQPKLKLMLSKTARDPQLIEKFNKEYQNISADLQIINEKIIELCKNEKINDSTKKVLINMGNKIFLLSNKIPSFDQASTKQLMHLAKALGGAYIHISQSELPFLRVNTEDYVRHGICAGMVIDWIDQSVTKGTPRYPISSDINVLKQQNSQTKYSESSLATAYAGAIDTLDLHLILANLEPLIPYEISMHDLTHSRGHSMGVRKHTNYIEIFDPNYGNLFFRNINTAALWFNALMRQYQITQFPKMTLKFNKRIGLGAGAIPTSTFPTQKIIDDATFLPHKSIGYSKMKESYVNHMHTLCKWMLYKNLDPPYSMLKSVIVDMNTRLSNEDRKRLSECLEKCEKNEPYDSQYSDLIPDFYYMVFSGVHLSDIHLVQKEIPDYINKALNQVAEQRASMAELIKEYDLKLIQARQTEKPNEDTINELVIKRDLLQSRLGKLDKLHIQEKLFEVLSGETNRKYSVKNAQDELDAVCPPDPRSVVEGPEVNERISILKKIYDVLYTYLSLHDEYIRLPSTPSTFDEAVKLRECKYLIDILVNNLEKIESLLLPTRTGENLDAIKIKLNELYPQKIDGNPNRALEKMLRPKIKQKYSESEMRELASLYKTVADLRDIVDGKLIANPMDEKEKRDNQFIQLYSNKASNFLEMIVDAIDPKLDKMFELKDFHEMMKYLQPVKIDWIIESKDLPNHIADSIAEFLNKNQSHATQTLARKCIKLHNHVSLNKMTTEEYFEALLKELHAPAHITPSRFTLQDFNHLFKMEIARREEAERLKEPTVNKVAERVNIIQRESSVENRFTKFQSAGAKQSSSSQSNKRDIRQQFSSDIESYISNLGVRKFGIYLPIKLHPFNQDKFDFAKEVKKRLDEYLSPLKADEREELNKNLVDYLSEMKKQFKEHQPTLDLIAKLETHLSNFQTVRVKPNPNR